MAESPQGKAVYRPEVFTVSSMEEAKRIILTRVAETDTDERWEKETPFLADELLRAFAPDESSVLLDYGCGIGRLAKELIERSGCTVIGIDISLQMRVLANSYVGSERFVATSREGLLAMLRHGLRVDHGYAIWVLQHCAKPAEDIALLRAGLRPDGGLYVANGVNRTVPTDRGWFDDGTDIPGLLEQRFELREERAIPEAAASELLRRHAFCRLYRAKAAETPPATPQDEGATP